MGLLRDIFDPGRKDRKRAAALADRGLFTGGFAGGPGGVSAGFDFSGNRSTVTQNLGSFQPLLEGAQGLGQFGIDLAQLGLPPELLALGKDTIGNLGDISVDRNANAGGQGALQQLLASDLGTATSDPFDLGAGIADKLRARESARNDRKVASTFDRLKASGGLGTTGGAGIASELDRSLADQNLGFDLAGLEFGAGRQDAARAGVFGGVGGLESIFGRNFGESFGVEQLEGSRALQQFGVGSSLQEQQLTQATTGTNIAGAGTNIATILQQLPQGMLQALLAAGGGASSTFFNAAGVNQANASEAKSPLLEAIKAAGGLVKTISNPTGAI